MSQAMVDHLLVIKLKSLHVKLMDCGEHIRRSLTNKNKYQHQNHDNDKKPVRRSLGSLALQAESSERQKLVRRESRAAGPSRSDPSPGSPDCDDDHDIDVFL